MIHCIRGDQISQLCKVWWLREALQIGQTFIPHVKKSFKAQHGRIPIDPAILAAVGHRFIAKKIRKLEMPKRGSEATRTETRETGDFFGLKQIIFLNLYPVTSFHVSNKINSFRYYSLVKFKVDLSITFDHAVRIISERCKI